ncbi:conserved membrane hypothetical protein [Microbacterium sp. 8M]|jgi:hypothetical protein|uniref:hypothetical protein n=1 Tax=Microbacterium sp. 8M TaxID=2653153 RepID=UPI0012EFF093|nr:hypothetical protein [Microbacterium sp. 8M]VXC26504.1 conserved membrane hypothetical protein [Microbacterium sp. 8M]
MRWVYVVLAWLVAAGVFVQAGSLAFAHVGLDNYIDHGGSVDSAFVEASQAGSVSVIGDAGFATHAANGMMVLPVLALLLLISSFFVRGKSAKLWALLVVALIALQITVAFTMFDMPYLGIVHGVNALAILLVAITAALRARRVSPSATTTQAMAPSAVGTTAGTERSDAIQA